MLPTPSQLIAYLDQYVTDQNRAKRDLSTAVYHHYLAQAYRERSGTQKVADFGKQHVLMMGPTGSGKTYLVRKLAEALKVPVAFCSATSLVEAGYRGQEIESVVSVLLERASRDVTRAERGIIFLDEIDKIRRDCQGGGRDVSGEGVQNGLLTMLDGREICGVNTGNVLFIAAGAFVELPKIVQRRIGRQERSIGFVNSNESAAPLGYGESLRRAELQDLVEFGFIPEFVGRFGTITAVTELDVAALTEILLRTRDSILLRQKEMASLHGIDLVFEDEAVTAIAEQALSLGTHARALNRVVLSVLSPVDWRLPELMQDGVTRITITAAAVREGAEPVMERGAPHRAVQTELDGLRRRAVDVKLNLSEEHRAATNPGLLTELEVHNRIEELKNSQLGYGKALPQAVIWWDQFEHCNRRRRREVLRLAEELARRDATITEFFLASCCSGTNDFEANLIFLDYTRAKKVAEKSHRPPVEAGEGGDEGEDEAASDPDDALAWDGDEDEPGPCPALDEKGNLADLEMFDDPVIGAAVEMFRGTLRDWAAGKTGQPAEGELPLFRRFQCELPEVCRLLTPGQAQEVAAFLEVLSKPRIQVLNREQASRRIMAAMERLHLEIMGKRWSRKGQVLSESDLDAVLAALVDGVWPSPLEARPGPDDLDDLCGEMSAKLAAMSQWLQDSSDRCMVDRFAKLGGAGAESAAFPLLVRLRALLQSLGRSPAQRTYSAWLRQVHQSHVAGFLADLLLLGFCFDGVRLESPAARPIA